MVFQFHIPASPLDQFIESFIYYRDFNPVHTIDRFLPDGNINVVFSLTDEPQYIYDNHSLKEIQACRHVWFSGMRNQYISIPSGRDSEMFIINFQKGRTFPFVQMPLHELTDSVVDAELVMTPEILNLREGILAARTIRGKFAYAENQLLRQFGKNLALNPFIDFAIHKILQSPHQLTVQEIARKVGYSQKHFIHLFKQQVGLSPKAFLKVMRFQKAIQEIEMRKDIHWVDIALESGYYDQAHFIHDFRNFSGFTPEQYMLHKNDQLNYVPVS